MPSYQFDRPIPGQSLTDEPRNAPYERPPEIVDPEEALMVHLTRLNDPEALEDIFFFMDMGVDVKTLTEGILRSAVLAGIHTVDVSMLIGPVIHEFIKTAADEAGVAYDEGFDTEDKGQKLYQRRKMVAKKKLKELRMEPDVSGVRAEEQSPMEEQDQMSMDFGDETTMTNEQPEAKPAGLMSRGM